MESEARPHNSTLAIGGVFPMKNRDSLYSADSFVVAESSVLRRNFCGVKPAHRQSAKRWHCAKQQPWANRSRCPKTQSISNHYKGHKVPYGRVCSPKIDYSKVDYFFKKLLLLSRC